MTKAVYPGTFDPMTLGHFDLIKRASKLYDKLVVAVAATSKKQGALFDAEERLAMIREDVKKAGIRNVEVKLLDTLLVDFCRREKAHVVIRGVRVYSDFEYEFQMALTNRRMAPEIETLFGDMKKPLQGEMMLEDLLIALGAASSKREARTFAEGNGVLVNGVKATDPKEVFSSAKALFGKYLIVRRGKKNYYLGQF